MESNLKRCPHVGEYFLFHVKVERQGRWRGVEFENLERLLSTDHLSLRPRGGGFPHLREMPRLVFNPEAGDPPRDLEGGFSGYWLMSERLRLAILSVDPLACAFVECDYRLVDGSPGPRYFLCDVVQERDALDERASTVSIETGPDFPSGRFYDVVGGSRLVFRPEALAGAHLFLTPHSYFAFCDGMLREAIAAAGIDVEQGRDGVSFLDVTDL
ncbi:DUF1629 domain-containing protein [Stenotrophomonas sp. Sm3119]|uniref:imm11 family protein n=1 Tax=Stenotrophomonas sp. Sm3119 TaxID=3002744 RepID=UPI0027E5967E|nr:DUF1629 domain-containing protein [Stenotrophomonas sp. Sm3119]MDQ7306486.1 DUF1629 domain-containing protein [Stenotrophomonas sp. Sm3119]